MAKYSIRANLEFQDKPWAPADKLRGNVDAAHRRNLEVLGYAE